MEPKAKNPRVKLHSFWGKEHKFFEKMRKSKEIYPLEKNYPSLNFFKKHYFGNILQHFLAQHIEIKNIKRYF